MLILDEITKLSEETDIIYPIFPINKDFILTYKEALVSLSNFSVTFSFKYGYFLSIIFEKIKFFINVDAISILKNKI